MTSKVSDVLVRCLEEEGVDQVFGVPGEENADFLLSLHASNIPFLLTRHEQGAAFMADAFGRLTGRAGVCLGTLGPGAANLVTGVADANMDRAPVVVLTGQAQTGEVHKESHQAMDVVGLFEPITKWSQSIVDPESVPEVVRKAFKLATAEKPGATHLELPEDVAKKPAGGRPIASERVRRPVPDEKIVSRAVEALRGAKKPIILAGNGAIRRRASIQLRRFAEQTGIGVASTFMGKGSLARDSPQCLFTVGMQRGDVVAGALDESDLVVTVGYDMVEHPPRIWNSTKKTIVHLDFLPAEVDQDYPVDGEVVGDLGHALWMLNERWAALSQAPSYDLAAQAEARRVMEHELAQHRDDDTKGSIRPQKVLADVRAALGPSDILLSDVGAHKLWVARHYHCDEPNTCLISNGFCAMGFALPGAIGAKLAHPDRHVLAICGDGGFLMNVQEMETAVRLQTPIVAVVWEDRGYGLIEWKQENEFGCHSDMSFGNPDFVKLAESFGWDGVRVERSTDLRRVLGQALGAKRPSLVVVPIDYRENRLLSERLGDLEYRI